MQSYVTTTKFTIDGQAPFKALGREKFIKCPPPPGEEGKFRKMSDSELGEDKISVFAYESKRLYFYFPSFYLAYSDHFINLIFTRIYFSIQWRGSASNFLVCPARI